MAFKLSDYFIPFPKQRKCLKHIGKGERIFFGGSRGGAKLSPLNSTVYTPFGARKMGDLKVGDIILNPNGSPQRIIQIQPHWNVDIYRMKFEDGATLEVGLDHLWLVHITSHGKSKIIDNSYLNDDDFGNGKIMDTRQIIEWFEKKKNSNDGQTIKNQHLTIPLCKPLKFTKSYKYDMRVIEPYLLGVLIGDGSLSNTANGNQATYTGLDNEIGERIRSFGYAVIDKDKKHIVRGKQLGHELHRLKIAGCKSGKKFIPEPYKLSTVEMRIELIQGLMDTDGYVDDRGHMSYTTISNRLAKDFQFIIRSLGGKATIVKNKAGYRDATGEYIQCQDAYTIYFNTKINPELVFVTRKKERAKYGFNGGISELRRRIISCEYVGKKDARCIVVDHPNSLYVADDFIVTHNSHLALAAAVLAARQFPKLKIVIIRKQYGALEEYFIERLQTLFPPTIFGYKYLIGKRVAVFRNGSRIIFRAAEREQDIRKVIGLEYQFMIIDEANDFTARQIDLFIGSLRNANVPDFEITLLMTGNPGGLADHYFITHFVEPDYSVWTASELKHKEKYIFIEANLVDNPVLMKDQTYRDNLESIQDEARRRAWLYGDWHVFQGQFFTEWDEKRHMVEYFDIPKDWRRVVGIDEGHSTEHPTVAYWAAQNPETLDVVVYREYESSDVTEKFVLDIKSLSADEDIHAYYGDPSMFASKTQRVTDRSTARMFLDEGIYIQGADNNRINGWRNLKSWLHCDTFSQKPKLTFFKSTVQFLPKHLPALRFTEIGNTEDCNTKMRDDEADALRYLMLSGFGYPTKSTLERHFENMLGDSIDELPQDEAVRRYLSCDQKDCFIEESVSNYNNWLTELQKLPRSLYIT
jgi:hypothetical protein